MKLGWAGLVILRALVLDIPTGYVSYLPLSSFTLSIGPQVPVLAVCVCLLIECKVYNSVSNRLVNLHLSIEFLGTIFLFIICTRGNAEMHQFHLGLEFFNLC